jgi:hypothetical protein
LVTNETLFIFYIRLFIFIYLFSFELKKNFFKIWNRIKKIKVLLEINNIIVFVVVVVIGACCHVNNLE